MIAGPTSGGTNDELLVNKTIKVPANTTIRESAGVSSRAIGVTESSGEYTATSQRNGFYFVTELNGWVMQSQATVVKDNSDNNIYASSDESQNEKFELDENTKDMIENTFTSDEREQIYKEFVNAEYGDGVFDVNNAGDELLVDNLNGIYGIPYQFPESVDPKPNGSSFGSIYAERIISRMPLLMLSPGKVDFMNKQTEGERLAVLDALIGAESNGDTDLASFIERPGKYYTFEYDEASYWKYVNAMNRACAVYLGIGDVVININGVSAKASDFKWEKATNNKFDSLMISSKSYVTFYADAETTKSESYSNSTKASQLADTVNSFSDVAKEALFLTGAHIGNVSWIDEGTISTAIEEIGKLSTELLNGQSLVNDIAKEFAVIATGGKLIFPEIWSDSEFTQSFDVKIKLRCPCPNKVSWFLDICVPINHLRALTLPRTPYGKGANAKDFDAEPTANGYFSPFLVRGFYKGLWNCDMGIVTDLNLSLGKEGSWTVDGLPSEVDVDMTIKDLYNVMAMTSTDQPKAFLNNTTFLNFLASSCGVSINKPDLDRSVEMWMMLNTNYWKDRLTGYSYWQKASQGIRNKLYNLYTGIFKG